MIRMEQVSGGYSRREVLRGIDMHVAAGEFVGIIGPNGSGKTTLLGALTGLVHTRGRIEIDGLPLASMSSAQRARRMAVVPQRFSDGLDMQVESLVIMGRYPYLSLLGNYTEEDRELAHRAMAETDTIGFCSRRAAELSGGELQRVVLARALAQNAPLLLLDEATSGLDHVRSIETFDLLSHKNRTGTTVVAVVHDLNLAALYCDRLVMLRDGRIVKDGPVGSVFTTDNLMDVFDAKISVAPHPETGHPQAFYLPGIASDSGKRQV